MSGIVLSSAVRQNLLSLQTTAQQLATTQNNLSTGNKVNSALDNPTNFFTASGLNNRAGDISNLLDGISNGVQVLQAANTGITSIQSLVSQAKSIANQALQTSIGYSAKSSFTSAAVTGATSTNLLGTGPTTYTAGTFTGTALVNGKTASPPAVTGASALTTNTGADSIAGTLTAGTDNLVVNGQTISFTSSGSTTTGSPTTGATINITSAHLSDVISAINAITGSTTASISSGALVLNSGTSSGVAISGTTGALSALGLNAGTSSGLSSTVTALSTSTTTLLGTSPTVGTPTLSGTTLTIGATGGGTASSIVFGTGASQVSTLSELNTALASNNLQATISSAGALTITTTNDAASSTIGALGGTAIGTGKPFNGLTIAAPTADATSQASRSTLVSQYNAILTQIDNTAADSSYNGVNLLAGDQLSLTFNETGKSKLSITGVNSSSAGLGLSTLTAGTAFIDNASTNSILTNLNSVSTNLRSQASSFGSNLSVVQTRQDFNKNLINVLQTGSANLTQADINLEAANSQALQTRQSLSVSALSLANQSQQSVLQLLR